MKQQQLLNGAVVLCLGFLRSSLSSIVDRFQLLGSATESTSGVFAGLSAVAYAAALVLMVRAGRSSGTG